MSNHQTISERIGIVVIGRNEGERLVRCLHSVLKAEVPVIYVDSQSSDNSVTESKSLNVTTVVLDTTKPISAARARNEGFKLLIHDFPLLQYVHFIDADCELDEKWLKTAIDVLDSDKKTAVVCGRLHEKYRNQSIYMRLCDMDWYRKPGLIDACGGIATYRSEIFEQLNGFNETLIAGEEPELCLRIRGKSKDILCVAEDMGTHDSAMVSFFQWWIRTKRLGYVYAEKKENYTRQYQSTLFWGIFAPVGILIASSWSYYSFLLITVYPIQLLRIFLNNKNKQLSRYDRILYAFFCLLGKIPQSQGIIKHLFNKICRWQQTIIEYKN